MAIHEDFSEIPRYGWRPEDELEVAELGARVSEELTLEQFATIYTRLDDRVMQMTLILAGRVARVTSWVGLRYPEAWLPDPDRRR